MDTGDREERSGVPIAIVTVYIYIYIYTRSISVGFVAKQAVTVD